VAVVSGLFSIDPNTVIVLACVIGAIQVAVHVLKQAFDLWFTTAGRKADPIERLADSLAEMAPEDEPYWPEKALHDSGARRLFDPTGYHSTGGVISTPPETASETSGRHALTESMPAVVDDEGAMAVPAVVSGEDGATWPW
jgi:hypothetical protein